jgi:hypothetical protein
VVRPQDEELKELLERFICVRITRMNDVDIGLFEFDYDLTWMCFFLDGNDQIASRYGGRDGTDAEGRVSVAGLKHTMRQVLADHRPPETAAPPRAPTPAHQVFTRARGCMHCHNVWEGLRDQERAAGTFTRESLDVYPLPENVGLTLDPVRGNEVTGALPDSGAQRAGLRAGDVLTKIDDTAIRAQGDVMRALHLAPAEGPITVHWRRGDQVRSATLEVAAGWKATDLSWRASVRHQQNR